MYWSIRIYFSIMGLSLILDDSLINDLVPNDMNVPFYHFHLYFYKGIVHTCYSEWVLLINSVFPVLEAFEIESSILKSELRLDMLYG